MKKGRRGGGVKFVVVVRVTVSVRWGIKAQWR